MKFLRAATADFAGIRIHDPEGQPEALEDGRVSRVHGLVRSFEALSVDIEGIGVLHYEFARTHHAEARPDFVAEFGLDLVPVER